MISEKLTFKNKEGHDLSALLDLPVDKKVVAYALLAHCFTCSKDLSAIRNISRALSMHGFAVMRFDFTGLGKSEGEFHESGFTTNIQDLIAAADHLAEHYEPPKLLVGHSLGGAAVLVAAGKIDSVKAVATIGAPADADHVQHLLGEDVAKIKKEGIATVQIGGRPFKVSQQFLQDIEQVSVKKHLENLRKSLLIFHSPQDKIVGIENAAEIYEAAHHPKSFITLDGADHLLNNKSDSTYVGNMLASWVERYIEMPEEEPLRSDKRVVARIGESGYTTEVRAGNHGFLSDEPKSVGGDDLGPTPYDLLVAGLSTCTAMTLRMYADRKKWDLQEVKVHLQHSKIHAEDCNDCEKEDGKIDQIEREIKIIGQVDKKQRQRLMEIANRCPVHRTLHGDIKVRTVLREVS